MKREALPHLPFFALNAALERGHLSNCVKQDTTKFGLLPVCCDFLLLPVLVFCLWCGNAIGPETGFSPLGGSLMVGATQD